jgi:putative sigma-54 modulation protein
MKVTYTGRHVDLTPVQNGKIDSALAKVGKLLDNGRGEVEARVVLSQQRHLNHAEITVPYHNHELVAEAEDADPFTAMQSAIEKLEKQALKVREKWRDGKRVPSERQETRTEALEE